MLQKNNIKKASRRKSILFFSKSCFKVAESIFNYPNKHFHIRGLANETGLSTTAVKSAIKDLEDYGIVKVENGEIATMVKADMESESYAFYKRVFNLYRLERWSFIENIRSMFDAQTIVLFGSFARGEDIEESDIDILAISEKPRNTAVDERVSGFLELMERELNRKVNVHVLPSLKDADPKFKNAVSNGIVLYGYLKVV